MNIVIEKDGVKKKVNVYDVLNNVPKLLVFHAENIQKEVNEIIQILNGYEEIKKVFNTEKLNIQTYVDTFLNGIKAQTSSILSSSSDMNKELKKESERPNIDIKDLDLQIEEIQQNKPQQRNVQTFDFPEQDIDLRERVNKVRNDKPTPAQSTMDAFLLQDMKRVDKDPNEFESPFVDDYDVY